MRYRHRVSALLILLFAITYIDRVCISVAGPRIQEALHIDPLGWGWVTAMFTLSYGLFEIPTGALGDRIGPRRVLTRVVLWWSVFTSLTGMVSNYSQLLIARLCFGAGEAGAFPNAAIVVSRWFPATQRASMSGVLLMASQIGGAIAPLLVVPIQIRYGWRASFYLFGVLGVLWSAIWYWWFRDSPAEKPGVSAVELAETAHLPAASHRGFPWSVALRSESVLALMGAAFCYVYVYNFFQTWFHTFLVKGRGFTEGSLRVLRAAVRGRRVRELVGWSRKRRSRQAPWSETGATLDRDRRSGNCGPVHYRGHADEQSAPHDRAAVAGVQGNHVPAIRRLRGLPGHRTEARGLRGWTDEHIRASRRPGRLRRLRIHRRTLRQL